MHFDPSSQGAKVTFPNLAVYSLEPFLPRETRGLPGLGHQVPLELAVSGQHALQVPLLPHECLATALQPQAAIVEVADLDTRINICYKISTYSHTTSERVRS